MSDFKHTPGPWRHSKRSRRTITNDGGDKLIARVFFDGSGKSPRLKGGAEQAISDARLIATSPELLKALMDSTDELDGLSNMFSDNEHLVNVLNGYVKRNRAVIAKAIGGQL